MDNMELKILDDAILQTILCMESIWKFEASKYTMLRNLRFVKKLPVETIQELRSKYHRKCMHVAFELKNWYTNNGIKSNTLCLRRRMETEKGDYRLEIKVPDDNGNIHSYTHHAVEVFFEHGKFKLIDALHSTEVVWLEAYLDELCKVNKCERSDLCYDLGLLAPTNLVARNMHMFNELLYFIDRVYKIGQPKCIVLFDDTEECVPMLASDVVRYDFSKLLGEIGISVTHEFFIHRWMQVYDALTTEWMRIIAPICIMPEKLAIDTQDEVMGKFLDAEYMSSIVHVAAPA